MARRRMGGSAGIFTPPSARTVVWTLLLSMAAIAAYNADTFGIRSRLIDPVFTPRPKA